MSQAADLIRQKFKESDDIRDAGLTTPDSVIRYDDIVYGQDPVWQSLDVYRPKAAGDRTLPVIISVHGGGWVYGDKARYQYYCMELAQRGFAVINFSYRLAPENRFPAALADTNAVFCWALNNCGQYGFDRDNIFAVGDSAGAHMLALYCGILTDPEYASLYPFTPPRDFVPRAVALNCGVYKMLGTMAAGVNPLIREALPGGGTPEELMMVDALSHVTDSFPPAFIMTAMGDFLKAQAPLMAEKLADRQIPFIYRLYGTAQEPLGHVFHCDIRSAAAKMCNDETCDFFKRMVR